MRHLGSVVAIGATMVLATMVISGDMAALALTANQSDGTPTAGTPSPMAPDPANCLVEPRPIEEVRDLIGVATPGAELPRPVFPRELPSGTAADDRTVAGVTRTIIEVVDCGNAADDLRFLALYSDIGLARLGPLPAETFVVVADLATPTAHGERSVIAWITRIELLDDGRAGAVVAIDDAIYETGPSGDVTIRDRVMYVILVQEGDRWLIEETFETVVRDGRGVDVADLVGTPAP